MSEKSGRSFFEQPWQRLRQRFAKQEEAPRFDPQSPEFQAEVEQAGKEDRAWKALTRSLQQITSLETARSLFASVPPELIDTVSHYWHRADSQKKDLSQLELNLHLPNPLPDDPLWQEWPRFWEQFVVQKLQAGEVDLSLHTSETFGFRLKQAWESLREVVRSLQNLEAYAQWQEQRRELALQTIVEHPTPIQSLPPFQTLTEIFYLIKTQERRLPIGQDLVLDNLFLALQNGLVDAEPIQAEKQLLLYILGLAEDGTKARSVLPGISEMWDEVEKRVQSSSPAESSHTQSEPENILGAEASAPSAEVEAQRIKTALWEIWRQSGAAEIPVQLAGGERWVITSSESKSQALVPEGALRFPDTLPASQRMLLEGLRQKLETAVQPLLRERIHQAGAVRAIDLWQNVATSPEQPTPTELDLLTTLKQETQAFQAWLLDECTDRAFLTLLAEGKLAEAMPLNQGPEQMGQVLQNLPERWRRFLTLLRTFGYAALMDFSAFQKLAKDSPFFTPALFQRMRFSSDSLQPQGKLTQTARHRLGRLQKQERWLKLDQTQEGQGAT